MTGDGPWRLGGYTIREVQQNASWDAWLDYANEQGCTPESAETRMRISFGFEQ
ncbi:MAG: hypothetical protein U9R74_06225 [Pseudomonadota bacterium]|nr:hypothetical protein [Pseudomonadota bacterium]